MLQVFAERLRALRMERNYTQGDLANLVNGNRSTMSGYENEGKEPDMLTICKFAKIFNVSTDYLLGYSDERNHINTIFFNDTVNYQKNYENMSPDNQSIIAKCFDDFYQLLNHDTEIQSTERLLIYQQLLKTLQLVRKDIRRTIEQSADSLDPYTMSEVMSKETELKNAVSALLDKLMQADMNITLGINSSQESSNNVAI